jgi:hypothetical protein
MFCQPRAIVALLSVLLFPTIAGVILQRTAATLAKG